MTEKRMNHKEFCQYYLKCMIECIDILRGAKRHSPVIMRQQYFYRRLYIWHLRRIEL